MRLILFIGKCLVGFLASIGLIVVALGVLAGYGWQEVRDWRTAETPVPERTVLTLDLASGVAEQAPMSPLAGAADVGVPIHRAIDALDRAAGDDRVKAVAVRIGRGALAMGHAQELRDALDDFRGSGKTAWAFAETLSGGGMGGGTLQSYLASAFDRVWLQPSGDVDLSGFLLESPYLADALQEIGVQPRLDQRREYKGIKDRFTAMRMPEPQRENQRQLLPQVLRRLQVTDLRETRQAISLPEGDGQLYLLMGLPDRCHRHRPDGIFTALNGRMVQLPELADYVLARLRRSLPRDRFPVIFLHLQAAPHQVDWHRSPDKSQVFLQHLDHWQEAIEQAIDHVLRGSQVNLSAGRAHQRLTQLLKLAEPGGQYHTAAGDDAPGEPAPLALRAIAQVHNRYILAEHPAGLCLIEQHIAHERVLYEELCDRWEIVPLATPIVLSALSPAQVEQLQRIGLMVEPFGPDLWAIRSLPIPLAERADQADALMELSLGGDLDSALVATACRTAIRNGTPLDADAMQRILDAWQRTRKPQTCPHGRPICLTLNESSLARYFRRSWVIGKSHGLEP